MRKVLIFSSLFLCAIVLKAQSYTSPQPSSVTDTPVTIQGCVNGGEGTFHLTDGVGSIYLLAGDNTALENVVGQAIEVTGTETLYSGNWNTAAAEANPGSAYALSAAHEPRLNVSFIRVISGNCNTVR